jgi:hypothetical protein
MYFEFNRKDFAELTASNLDLRNRPDLQVKKNAIQDLVIAYYYNERIYLLECIYQILLIDKSTIEGRHVNSIRTFAKTKFNTLGSDIWKDYLETSTKEVDERISGEIQQKEEWVLQNAKEQFHLLKILHLFYFERNDISAEQFLSMLEHLNSNIYTRNFLRFEKQSTILELYQQREEYFLMGKELAILTLLNCMNLNSYRSLDYAKAPISLIAGLVPKSKDKTIEAHLKNEKV